MCVCVCVCVEIPCLDCNKSERIYELMRDLKKENMNNGLIKHNLKTSHNFYFKDSNMFVYVKKIIKTLENFWI